MDDLEVIDDERRFDGYGIDDYRRLIREMAAAGDRRGVIGLATGVLMERFKVDADEAFEILRESAHRLRVRTLVAAEHLAATRELPLTIAALEHP